MQTGGTPSNFSRSSALAYSNLSSSPFTEYSMSVDYAISMTAITSQ